MTPLTIREWAELVLNGIQGLSQSWSSYYSPLCDEITSGVLSLVQHARARGDLDARVPEPLTHICLCDEHSLHPLKSSEKKS